jgi:uncharacterized protein YjcR
MTHNKRNRGGQTGNQNARKHGFYSTTLSPAETSRVLTITRVERVDPPVALIRVKLQSSLERNPHNRRVLAEAARLLTKWYSAQYRLDGPDRTYLRTVVRMMLESRVPHHPPPPISRT